MRKTVLNVCHCFDLLLTGDKFQHLQQTFLDEHCMVFDSAEENKLIYTDIHRAYVNILNCVLYFRSSSLFLSQLRLCSAGMGSLPFLNLSQLEDKKIMALA